LEARSEEILAAGRSSLSALDNGDRDEAEAPRGRRLTVVVREGGEVTGEGAASRGDAAGRIGCAEGLTDADTDSDRVDGAADEHDDASLHDRSWKKKYMGAG
jgi:hypothetical protein